MLMMVWGECGEGEEGGKGERHSLDIRCNRSWDRSSGRWFEQAGSWFGGLGLDGCVTVAVGGSEGVV